MVGVGRDLWGSSSPAALPKQGHLEQPARPGAGCTSHLPEESSLKYHDNDQIVRLQQSAA